MGVCSRESPPGLWSPEVGCFSNNCIALPDTTALMPNNKSLSALMFPVSVWISNVVYHNVLAFIAETWHSRILNHGVWSHLAVCVPGCAPQGCVLPSSAGWSSGASMSISSLWLSVMRNPNSKLKVMEIGLFLVARFPALAGGCQHRSPQSGSSAAALDSSGCWSCGAWEGVGGCDPQLWGCERQLGTKGI